MGYLIFGKWENSAGLSGFLLAEILYIVQEHHELIRLTNIKAHRLRHLHFFATLWTFQFFFNRISSNKIAHWSQINKGLKESENCYSMKTLEWQFRIYWGVLWSFYSYFIFMSSHHQHLYKVYRHKHNDMNAIVNASNDSYFIWSLYIISIVK